MEKKKETTISLGNGGKLEAAIVLLYHLGSSLNKGPILVPLSSGCRDIIRKCP